MNLYKIWQDENNGYDTYDSAIVCVETEQDAVMTHPYMEKDWNGTEKQWGSWCNAKDVKVKLIGVAAPGIKRVLFARRLMQAEMWPSRFVRELGL